MSTDKVVAGILTILLSLNSCVRDIVLDPGDDPMVVVDCVIGTKPQQSLKLFYAKIPAGSTMEPISDAQVELIDKTDDISVGYFTYKETSENWFLDYEAVPCHEYRLEISIEGKSLIYAEDKVPDIPHVTACHHVPGLDDSNVWNGSSSVQYSSYEGSTNIVNTLDFKYGMDFNGMTYSIGNVQDNILWVNALTYNYDVDEMEMTSTICSDYMWIDNFNLTGDTYNPFERKFLDDVDIWNYKQLLGQPVHSLFLRLENSGVYDQSDFLISADFLLEDKPEETWHCRPCYIVFTAVSDAYDKYTCDAVRLKMLQDSSDMSEIYLRDNIYSNINGGIGIFGATSSLRLPWCWSETRMPEE